MWDITAGKAWHHFLPLSLICHRNTSREHSNPCHCSAPIFTDLPHKGPKMCLLGEIQDTAGARGTISPRIGSSLCIPHSPGLGCQKPGLAGWCHLTPASPKILPWLAHGKPGSGSCRAQELSTTVTKLFVRNPPRHIFQGQTLPTSAAAAQVIPSRSICSQPPQFICTFL